MPLFTLSPPILSRPLTRLLPPSWLRSPLHVVIPSTIVGSFKFKKSLLLGKNLGSNLSLPTIFFLQDFHSFGKDYHPLEVSSLCNWMALLQPNCKREKKGDVWPSSHGETGEWMGHVCPKEFGYISLRGKWAMFAPRSLATFPWGKTCVPKDIVLYFSTYFH